MTNEMQMILAALAIHEARHPRPYHVTQTQAAEMLGKSRPTIAKMVRFGTFKLNKCGCIPIEQIDAALRAN